MSFNDRTKEKNLLENLQRKVHSPQLKSLARGPMGEAILLDQGNGRGNYIYHDGTVDRTSSNAVTDKNILVVGGMVDISTLKVIDAAPQVAPILEEDISLLSNTGEY